MNWKYRPIDPVLARSLAQGLGQPYKCGEFLTARGFGLVSEVREFVTGDLKNLPAPETMPGLNAAVALLLEARKENRLIAIAGDYDVDGLTSTALLRRVLTDFGYQVITRVPNRLSEGYGLSTLAVSELIAQGAGLLVTVDCGVSDWAAIDLAAQKGLPVVVTDHHQLPPKLPKAKAIINPHLGGGWEKNPLAGVGVAFMLAWGLTKALKKEGLTLSVPLVENLALVALGTIADLVPLKGVNRILARQGLNFLAQIAWPGLAALRKRALKNNGEFVSTRDVGFKLAPRLNAAGRLGQAEIALELLLATDHTQAEALADKLEVMNKTRLRDQMALLEQALETLADQELESGGGRVVALAGDGWPRGLLGLAATRVAEITNRPTIIFSLEGDLAIGSGRSVPGFNLFMALEPLRDLCLSMGGHAQAAGLKLVKQALPRFREALEESASLQPPPEPEPLLEVDLVVDLPDLALIGPILVKLAPFGPSHPAPVAVIKNAHVLEAAPTKTGGDQHIMVRLFDGSSRVNLVGFGLAPRLHEIGSRLDVAVLLETERFGRMEPNWRLLDFKSPA
ncbi:MAG: single-stranded-DNA-specific exonuclease RecJ [Deltaproteobacteria bacterium]|nr:single-stranded-DNA-specific exonuclease RecJ [Deltaproteobacteria bacterium]